MKLLSLFIFLAVIVSFEAKAFLPSEAYTFDFNVKTNRISRYKENKLMEAVELLREVFASEDFRKKILNHRFRGKYRYSYNKGLTNYQIYKRILKGREELYPYVNNAMDVEIDFFTNHKSIVIGYTWPHSKKIWMNTKYFNRFEVEEIASHLLHEWLHKLGFDHERNRTHDRQFSVPYAIGRIAHDIAREINENRN